MNGKTLKSRDDLQNKVFEIQEPNVLLEWVTRCHTKNYKILMYDGTTKNVQDLKIGDVIMGDDSTPRNILSLVSGEDACYKITPKKGDSFIVNENHILVLEKTNQGSCYHKKGGKLYNYDDRKRVVEISVKDYLKTSTHFKHLYKLKKQSVLFEKNDLVFEPYYIGLWLGDGFSCNSNICKPDLEIQTYCQQLCNKYNLNYRFKKNINYISRGNAPKKINTIFNNLKKLNLLKNKHIPFEYLTSSIKERELLLAGLIDSDGYKAHNCLYEITQKKELLSNQIVSLARSLGFSTSIKTVYKSCTNGVDKTKKPYYKISISGNFLNFPILINKKKSTDINYFSSSRSSFKIEKTNDQVVYGFTVDGNNRYLDYQYIIHHNCGKSKAGLNLVYGNCLIIVPTNYIKQKTWLPLIENLPGKYKVICYKSIKGDLGKWDSVILDELHSLTESHLPVLKKINPTRWIGLSATIPYEKKLLWTTLVGKFHHWKIDIKQAVEWGILPKPEVWIGYIKLDNESPSMIYEKTKDKAKKTVILNYDQRFEKHPSKNIHIRCTEAQYYELLQNQLTFWNNVLKVKQSKYEGLSDEEIKKALPTSSNIPLLGLTRKIQDLGQKRKMFFVEVKSKYYEKLYTEKKWKDKRHVVFCGSTDQANRLGGNRVVHSNNPESSRVYQDFLLGKINQLYSVHMLDEGLELGSLDFLVIIQGTIGGQIKKQTENIQRLGRSLTSLAPKTMIFVVQDTRDEAHVSPIFEFCEPEWINRFYFK